MEVEEESKDVASQRSLFTRDDHRPRLLYITGTSFITIARKAVRRAEQFNGPVGNLTRTFASVMSPIINPLEHHCLLILSSLDDRILATQDIAMQVFPPSMHLFNKFDELAILLNSLPEKFDQVFDQIAMLIHKFPLIEWPLDQLIYVLQTLTSTVEKLIPELQFSTSESSSYNSSQEREIMVDINCDEQCNVDGSKEENVEDARRARKVEEDMREVENTCNEIIAALEKMGKVEEDSSADVRGPPPPPPPPPKLKLFLGDRVKKTRTRKHVKDNAEIKDDQILELFDEGWLKR